MGGPDGRGHSHSGGEGGQSGNGVESRLVGLGPWSYRYGWGLCPRLWRASPHAVPPHPHSQRLSPLSGLLTTSLHSVMGRPPFVQVLGFKG